MSARRRARARAPRPAAASAWTDIVVGVVEADGKVLVARRPAAAHLGDYDEFPGGKREAGESLEAACAREVKEETGLDVEVGRLLHASWFEGDGRRLALSFFACRPAAGARIDAAAAEQRSVRFVAREELARLRFPPANAEVVRRLLEAPAGGA